MIFSVKTCAHVHFIWGGQGLDINLGEWEGLFRVKVNHWLEYKALGMPYLHEEESQVLAKCDLIRREEVEPVTWLPG